MHMSRKEYISVGAREYIIHRSCAVRCLCVHCTSVMNSKTNICIDNAVAVMLSPAPGECKHALG